MKKLFIKKMLKELYLFRNALVRDDKRTIIEKSYKIDTMFRLYDILHGMVDHMSTETIVYLLLADIDILESLYATWIKQEDMLPEELKQFVEREVYNEVMKMKEKIYGEEYNNQIA